jgi:hypothetical protein
MSDSENADLIWQDRTPTTLPRWVVESMFDALTSSMDFSSGFLSDEDILALRECARVLGVNPKKATPRDQLLKFCPGHEFGPTVTYSWGSFRECVHCNQRTEERRT